MAAGAAELLRQAQTADEDRRYGKDQRGDELPDELAFREGRLEKLQEAVSALEAEAQAADEPAEAEGLSIRGCPTTKPSVVHDVADGDHEVGGFGPRFGERFGGGGSLADPAFL